MFSRFLVGGGDEEEGCGIQDASKMGGRISKRL